MDNEVKIVEHIKLIQQIISRMSSAMLSIKALSLTVFSILIGFAVKDNVFTIFIIIYPLVLLFMFLDMYYLWQEKLYKSLYNFIKEQKITNFSMNTIEYKKKNSYFKCFLSVVIFPFYLSIFFINTLIFIINYWK